MHSLNAEWKFTENPGEELKEILNQINGSSHWLLCDRNTKKHCLPLISEGLPANTRLLCLPAGEASKTLKSAETIWEALSKKNADRLAVLICLGGGMISDLGGFAASVYKRGIPFVFIPTSLLSMADACLGGKTGIDFLHQKNQLGSFARPEAILLYPGFLKTLPDAELLSGMAEVCKHALCGNREHWQLLRKAEVHRQNWSLLLQGSLEFKSALTGSDPFEKGERKILNAGHTIGHALESFFLERGNPQPHGFCVAAGLICEGRIAVQKGLLEEAELLQAEEFIYAEFGLLPIEKKDIPAIVRHCRQDKKNLNGRIRASLFGPIGQCHTDQEITEEEIKMALRYYLGS